MTRHLSEFADRANGLALLGVDFGDPFHVKTFSGSSRHIWGELQRRDVLVDAFTPYPATPLVTLYKLRAFRADKRDWRASWRRSVPFRRYLSRRACRTIREQYDGRFRACLQIGAYYNLSEALHVPRALLADNNCAITQRTNRTFQSTDRVYRQQYEFERQVYASMDHVFCFSEFLANSMVQDFSCDPARVRVVGAGINVPAELIRNDERDFGGRSILFAGYDWVQKGGPSLLKAFSIVRRAEPSARLVLLGPRPPNVPPGVISHGPLSKSVAAEFETICRAFREATVFVLPTLADAFPNVIREAMASGLPCVASDIGSIPEMVDEGVTGYLVPVNDPDVLADRLLRLLRDPERARAMGAAGYARYLERFTWSRVCDTIISDLSHTAAGAAMTGVMHA